MTTENRERAQAYRNRLFPGFDSPLACTDPEFVERMDNFAFGEVPASDDLDDRTRMMAILAALIGAQAIDLFKAMAKGAFNVGVTSVEMKELVYQSTPYVGMGRMLPFLYAVNELLEHRLVSLPLESQATTTEDTRLEAGAQKQVDLFGEDMVTSCGVAARALNALAMAGIEVLLITTSDLDISLLVHAENEDAAYEALKKAYEL